MIKWIGSTLQGGTLAPLSFFLFFIYYLIEPFISISHSTLGIPCYRWPSNWPSPVALAVCMAMGACLRSLYLSRAGAVAGTVAGAFSRPCHESRSRRLGPALATRCMRRLLFIAPGAVAGAPSSPRTGDAARACPRFVAGWGGGERSRRDRCRSASGHVTLERILRARGGARYYLVY